MNPGDIIGLIAYGVGFLAFCICFVLLWRASK